MTMSLNTGHALYGNLKMLIGVEDTNALVDLVTPGRTFTPHANAVFGSGTLGRHFGVRRSGYSAYGASFTDFIPANNTGTLVVVVNAVTYIEPSTAGYGAFIGTSSASPWNRALPQIAKRNGNGFVGLSYNAGGGDLHYTAESSTAVVSASAKMMTLTRNGTTAYALYVNGNTTPEASGTQLGTNETGGKYNYIGGLDGNAPMDANIVWIAWFDKALTPTEISDLYATLGASNAFGLVSASSAATATTASGPASGTVGVASTNFTVGVNGTPSGTVTITPGDVGDGGTFTPASVAVSSGTLTATFTYTAASPGVKTITISDDGGLTDAASLSYTASAAASGDVSAASIRNQRFGVNFYGAR